MILVPAYNLRPSRSRLPPVTRKSAEPAAAQRQQIIIVRVRSDRDGWKVLYDDGDVAQLVDQPPGERRCQAFA